ncbi:hypothetical protein SAY86_003711 [Trapa natans]|uniref:Uncharacterized protein n=1 Tax=Trapa natans TaxID=22666 RepID=A0AAN7MEQ1_TRANT|nr:hypothetical protein SAY86_003711 [Trapa natans]
MKLEKALNYPQDVDSIANPKISFDSHGSFSDLKKEMWDRKCREVKVPLYDDEPLNKVSEVDKKTLIKLVSSNGSRDGEESEYSSMKNEVDSGTLRLKRKVDNGSILGNIYTLEQHMTDSSSSSLANFVIPSSSNDSCQESTADARTFKGSKISNTNTSSMSSTCTDLRYHPKETKVSSMEPGTIGEIKPLPEKLTDVPKTYPSKRMSFELAREEFYDGIELKTVSAVKGGDQHLREREQGTLSGIDLNEETAHSIEVEQETIAYSVKNVRKPVPVFATRDVRRSSPEIWFKGQGNGGWKGSASTTSAFRPTCHLKGIDCSTQKQVKGIDLNVEADGIESEKKFPNRNVGSVREKFSIDLNVASDKEENCRSSRALRDFDLNDDLTPLDSHYQEGREPSFNQEAMVDHKICALNHHSEVSESHHIGQVYLPLMTSKPFVRRGPEQAENSSRAFPFNPSVSITESQNPVFSLTGSPSVPLYPVHLNGIPGLHGGHNLVKAGRGPPCYLYSGMGSMEIASPGGTASPMHPLVPQQLTNFQNGGLLSLGPMKRMKPDGRWNSHLTKSTDIYLPDPHSS